MGQQVVKGQESGGQTPARRTELLPEAGGTRLRAQRERLESFATFLLGLGVDFRVDGPPELRTAFDTLAQRCAQQAAYTGP